MGVNPTLFNSSPPPAPPPPPPPPPPPALYGLSALDAAVVSKIKRFRATAKESYRCALVFDKPDEMLVGAKVHWDPMGKRFVRCKSAACCEMLGHYKWRVGCSLLVYENDYSLYSWIFGESTYIQLRELQKSFPLTKNDYSIRCDIEEYQKVSVFPASDHKCNWLKLPPKDRKLIKEVGASIQEFNKAFIGVDIPREDMAAAFAGVPQNNAYNYDAAIKLATAASSIEIVQEPEKPEVVLPSRKILWED